MIFIREIRQHPEFRRGAQDMLGAALGISAWGLMTGVAMAKSGMSVPASLLMAVTVFAGSSQLAAMPLMTAEAPLWVILATGLCVNLRFVVFSAHLRPYMMHLSLWRRLAHGYLMADLSYVSFIKRYPHPVAASDTHGLLAQEAYITGNCFVNWISWVSASVLGVILANFIPTQWGLGFAGILALVGILCSLANTKMRVLSAIVAGIAAVIAYALPLKLNILVAIVAAVAACLITARISPRKATP